MVLDTIHVYTSSTGFLVARTSDAPSRNKQQRNKQQRNNAMDGTGETAGRLLEDDDPVTQPKGPPEPAGHFDLTGDDDVVDVLAHELSSLHSPTVVECNYPRCTFSNAELKPNPCDCPACDRRVHHFCCATFCNRHGLADPEGQTRYCALAAEAAEAGRRRVEIDGQRRPGIGEGTAAALSGARAKRDGVDVGRR